MTASQKQVTITDYDCPKPRNERENLDLLFALVTFHFEWLKLCSLHRNFFVGSKETIPDFDVLGIVAESESMVASVKA